MLALLRIGTLNGNIQTNQRFTGAGNTGYEANGLSAVCLAVFDDTVNLIGSNCQIFCSASLRVIS